MPLLYHAKLGFGTYTISQQKLGFGTHNAFLSQQNLGLGTHNALISHQKLGFETHIAQFPKPRIWQIPSKENWGLGFTMHYLPNKNEDLGPKPEALRTRRALPSASRFLARLGSVLNILSATQEMQGQRLWKIHRTLTCGGWGRPLHETLPS